jgi:uncharacterized phiE125 gp8 family phage protein
MFYLLHTAPATEPVTLNEAKNHLRIDHTDDDTYVGSLIKVARQHVERITNYVCIASTWHAYSEKWSVNGRLYIMKHPVTAVSKVEYFPSNSNTYIELPGTQYQFERSYPSGVYVKNNPALQDSMNAIKLTFTAGHANTVGDPVPAEIQQAILILIGHLYENRQEEVTGTIVSRLSAGFRYLCDNITMIAP